MVESILTSIKKLLGIEEEYTHFDTDITMYINTALMRLNQLGIGPTSGFKIQDKTAVWSDLLDEHIDLEGVKTFVYLKVRLVFDPPQMGYLVEAIKDQIKELEWTLNVQAENES